MILTNATACMKQKQLIQRNRRFNCVISSVPLGRAFLFSSILFTSFEVQIMGWVRW